MSEPFIGEITIFAGNFAPRGWSLCDGQLLAISQNNALFSLLGTTYGGDGRTTFALPELRGRVPVHPGTGPGLSQIRWGQKAGAENVTLNTTQIPSHTHSAAVSMNRATDRNPAGMALAQAESDLYVDAPADTADLSGTHSEAISNAGGSQNHSNTEPYIGLNFIIALVGTFPSRT